MVTYLQQTAEGSEASGSTTDRERAADSRSNDGMGRCVDYCYGGGENEKRDTADGERKSQHALCLAGVDRLLTVYMKGTDDGHQPRYPQDMGAKPVATKPEARVAAQAQGVVPGQSYLAAVRRLGCRPLAQQGPNNKGKRTERRAPSGGSDSVLCTWPAWLRLGRAPWLDQPSKG